MLSEGEMKLTVLMDNNTFIDRYFIAEPAVSYLIECEGKKILFDAGYSDAFLINARKLDIELLDIDAVVLSHGHQDHTWGLGHLIQYYSEERWMGKHVPIPDLIAHPDVFKNRSFESDPEIGSLIKEDTLGRFFKLRYSKNPLQLTKELTFLGEIERNNSFEAQQGIGRIWQDGNYVPDMVMDDTALVYETKRGLVLITGCSHAGICNIAEYARKVTGQEKIVDIIGGFHLLNPSKVQMEGTLAYFKALSPDVVHACHCTDLRSKIELSSVANLQEVGVGLELEY